MNDADWAGRKGLATPVLAKTDSDMAWPPGEQLFYMVSRNGLYACRQSEFFNSSVKAPSGPSGLVSQTEFFEPKFPKIPAMLIERAVGFFSAAADLHGCEAAALLAYDRSRNEARLVVPNQTATMGGAHYGRPYPIGVRYDFPTDLPDDWVVFGDIHCHVDYAAYASNTDIDDELHSAGLHIVVGRINRDSPEFHVEAVVDGTRFVLQPADLFEGFEDRRFDFPNEWLERIQIETYESKPYYSIYPTN